MKYIIGHNKHFWEAIHRINSAPLWKCVVVSSWPLNPKNRKSKLVITVKDDDMFKIIATASNLKYSEYTEWKCRRCGATVDMVNKRCKCKTSPSPWEPYS